MHYPATFQEKWLLFYSKNMVLVPYFWNSVLLATYIIDDFIFRYISIEI